MLNRHFTDIVLKFKLLNFATEGFFLAAHIIYCEYKIETKKLILDWVEIHKTS
jgi:hypothetical protein